MTTAREKRVHFLDNFSPGPKIKLKTAKKLFRTQRKRKDDKGRERVQKRAFHIPRWGWNALNAPRKPGSNAEDESAKKNRRSILKPEKKKIKKLRGKGSGVEGKSLLENTRA